MFSTSITAGNYEFGFMFGFPTDLLSDPEGSLGVILKNRPQKQTNQDYSRGFEIELSGVLKFSTRTYFCNLSLANCCCDTGQK